MSEAPPVVTEANQKELTGFGGIVSSYGPNGEFAMNGGAAFTYSDLVIITEIDDALHDVAEMLGYKITVQDGNIVVDWSIIS